MIMKDVYDPDITGEDLEILRHYTNRRRPPVIAARPSLREEAREHVS